MTDFKFLSMDKIINVKPIEVSNQNMILIEIAYQLKRIADELGKKKL